MAPPFVDQLTDAYPLEGMLAAELPELVDDVGYGPARWTVHGDQQSYGFAVLGYGVAFPFRYLVQKASQVRLGLE